MSYAWLDLNCQRNFFYIHVFCHQLCQCCGPKEHMVCLWPTQGALVTPTLLGVPGIDTKIWKTTPKIANYRQVVILQQTYTMETLNKTFAWKRPLPVTTAAHCGQRVTTASTREERRVLLTVAQSFSKDIFTGTTRMGKGVLIRTKRVAPFPPDFMM